MRLGCDITVDGLIEFLGLNYNQSVFRIVTIPINVVPLEQNRVNLSLELLLTKVHLDRILRGKIRLFVPEFLKQGANKLVYHVTFTSKFEVVHFLEPFVAGCRAGFDGRGTFRRRALRGHGFLMRENYPVGLVFDAECDITKRIHRTPLQQAD